MSEVAEPDAVMTHTHEEPATVPVRGTAFVALADLRSNTPVFDELCAGFEAVRVASTRERATDELMALGSEVTAAVVGVKERIDARVLDALPNLRAVGSVGTGTDHLDLSALHDRGIHVVTTPGVNAVSVAEHAMMMILALAKRALDCHTAVLSGRDRAGLSERPVELRGRRVGVLGAGATARALLPMLRAFGMKTAVWTRTPERHPDLPVTDLAELFSRSDIVSVHLPLTDRTRGLVDARLMSLLPDGAIVVNTARKEVLDLAALPGLAVTRPDLRLGVDDFGLAADGTAAALGRSALFSPHTAGITVESLSAMQKLVVRETLRALITP
jgi:phosphoglycerate dehydrogenase-like enzyme